MAGNMIIRNSSNGRLIASGFELCTTNLRKARGLMFSKEKTLIFQFNKERLVPLHMFFVFFPIDVLFLDKEKRVVEIKPELKPFRTYTPKAKSMYVIELKKGSIKVSGTKKGDLITF